MSLGIAFSGGGVPAAISAACAWNAIVETYPSILEPSRAEGVTISTVSGGSIGYGLWVNARDKIQFTPYRYNMTLEELHDKGNDNLNQADFSESLGNLFSPKVQLDATSCDKTKWTVGEIAGHLFSPIFLKQIMFGVDDADCPHWWNCMVKGVFDSLCVDGISSGHLSWLTSFAFFDQAAMFDRISEQGTLTPSSAESLSHVIVDMNTEGNPKAGSFRHSKQIQKLPLIDALSYSSAFWASNVLTNNMLNLLFNDMLIKGSTSESDVFIIDGGVIDTTGIIGLLKQRKERIVVFYNNNVPLSSVSSPIAYLFGVDVPTDAMNSLKGPILSQVFPSSLYPAVIQNLTNPDSGVVQMNDVPIVQNQMGVEPYILSSLVIISNGNMNSFQYKDSSIHSQLDPKWPDQFPYGLPTLDANVLCAFNDYKVKDVLKPLNILEY